MLQDVKIVNTINILLTKKLHLYQRVSGVVSDLIINLSFDWRGNTLQVLSDFFLCFLLFPLQVGVTRKGRSSDLHSPPEDGTFQDSVARSCRQIWHGDSSCGRNGCQPQSSR